jgi:hypothetical protein
MRLAKIPKNVRDFSSPLYELSFALQKMSPKAYRLPRQIFPFACPKSFEKRRRRPKSIIKEYLTDRHKASELMTGCREAPEISVPVPCVSAFDAISMTAMGIKLRNNSHHAFRYIILPLYHELPISLIHSVPHMTDRIDTMVVGMRSLLHEILN